MGIRDNGNGGRQAGGLKFALCLSGDEHFEAEKRKQAERSVRQKAYYADWKSRHERVTGSLTKQDYAKVLKRADGHGRRVWEQVWAESQAYVSGTIVPTGRMVQLQEQLQAELNRIGNNINQLAKLGHIEARKHGGLKAVDHDAIGRQTLKEYARLEQLFDLFGQQMAIMASAGADIDHEDDQS
jgi:hypothetical protein